MVNGYPNVHAGSSSSEYEEEEEFRNIPMVPPEHNDTQSFSLMRWLVIFICMWQSVYNISSNAIQVLLKFLSVFFKILGGLSTGLAGSIASLMPSSTYLLQKYLMLREEEFVSFVICPSCFSLYVLDDCFEVDSLGDRVPRRCSFVQFPEHPQANRQIRCNSPLLKKVHLSGGKIIYKPNYIYAYQPLKKSFQRLLMRAGFAEKLEHWRNREAKDDLLSDIYDGQVWKEFNSPKYGNFLKNRRACGLMLNMDFFQPYKHVRQSYGVLYLSLMNLPRSERFKQENILLVGVIPAFEHEPSSLNPFLKPLVDEFQEFWASGVRLYTAESPKYKLLFRLALMCVACDIPAARKCCGFKGHNANMGCSRCGKSFPGGFGSKDFSGFNRDRWPSRDLKKHKDICMKLKSCKTLTNLHAIEVQTGIKYSILVELEYFDPIRFTIVDPMHNLFLGTAKTVIKQIWLKRGIIQEANFPVLQTRVDIMTVPSDLGRIPHKILSSFGSFTAEQWKNWVIIYSMFALRGILPQSDYVCWQTFVLACFFLCRRAISKTDLVKADLLLIKFCKKVEELYGNNSITPNMHLHGHLADCIKDYGSVYGFWLFSFERYNGTLGNFHTNKKNVTVQLMRHFIFESQCHQLATPDMFKDEFYSLLPIQRNISEIHLSCSSFSGFQYVSTPSVSKVGCLSPSDYAYLTEMYSHLYNTTIDGDQMTYTVKIFKSITLYGRQFGSLRSPSTKHSAYLFASWADHDGSLNESAEQRPGRVLYYILHKLKINSVYQDHVLAVVHWYSEHSCHSLYGKPLEIWSTAIIPEGPSMYLPVTKIIGRCGVCRGRMPNPSGTEEEVLFVSVLPNLIFY